MSLFFYHAFHSVDTIYICLVNMYRIMYINFMHDFDLTRA